jgi:hypothetical protein
MTGRSEQQGLQVTAGGVAGEMEREETARRLDET